jgi:hypothetical protein
MAHTKEQLADLEAKAKVLEDIRHALYGDYSDEEFRELLIDILARDDGTVLRLALNRFEGDAPDLKEEVLKICQHPKLKPLLPQ